MKQLENKIKFLENLGKEELKKGYIKFNIPDENDMYSLNGEGVWAYVSEEDKEKYFDDSYKGKILAILCDDPINHANILSYGTEVVLQCHGKDRATLDPEWIIEILNH